jgi:hypothetical protein
LVQNHSGSCCGHNLCQAGHVENGLAGTKTEVSLQGRLQSTKSELRTLMFMGGLTPPEKGGGMPYVKLPNALKYK